MKSIHAGDTFAAAVKEYFLQTTYEPCNLGTGFIIDQKPILFEYTGLITLAGLKKGMVYFSAKLNMLRALAGHILGTAAVERSLAINLVGEIVNEIAGHTRKIYGSKLDISLPEVLNKKEAHKRLIYYLPAYLIPVHWQSYNSYLTIHLEK